MGIGSNDKDYGFINLQTCIQSPFCFWVVNCRWWLSSSTISIYIAVPYIANSAKKKVLGVVWTKRKRKVVYYLQSIYSKFVYGRIFFNNAKLVWVQQQYCVLYVLPFWVISPAVVAFTFLKTLVGMLALWARSNLLIEVVVCICNLVAGIAIEYK